MNPYFFEVPDHLDLDPQVGAELDTLAMLMLDGSPVMVTPTGELCNTGCGAEATVYRPNGFFCEDCSFAQGVGDHVWVEPGEEDRHYGRWFFFGLLPTCMSALSTEKAVQAAMETIEAEAREQNEARDRKMNG